MPKSSFSTTIATDQLFIYTLTLPVRIDDINYGQHLAATAVPKLLQQVRVKFLTSLGFSEINIGGVGILIVDLYVRYLCESSFDDRLHFELGIEHIENANTGLVYRITNQTRHKAMAVAKEKMLFFDYEKKKVTKVPEVFRQTIKQLEQTI